MRVAAAQTPEFREDVDAALAWLDEAVREARREGCELVCFPEGYLQGYLTEAEAARRVAFDLASPAFSEVLARLPAEGPVLVFGLIEIEAGRLFNSAVVVRGGRLMGRYRKANLLGGERCFEPGTEAPAFCAGPLRFGINICFDTNFPEAARTVADLGASLIVCPANNMMRREAAERWKHEHNRARGERCRETGLWLLSSDVTGERDGRIAWGPTALLNPAGEVVAQLPLERPGLLVVDVPVSG